MFGSKDNINVTKLCVSKEICDANVYYNLIFIWINNIMKNQVFYKNFRGMFNYIEEALVTKYIFALTKIFAKTKEEGLWKLIIQVKEIPVSLFELRLKRDPPFIHDDIRQQRTEFFKNFDSYVVKIKEIQPKLTALRNKQRAHNFPFMSDGQKVIWAETKEWLTFSENVFCCAMTAICEGSFPPGQFIPEDLNVQMKNFTGELRGLETLTKKEE